MFVLGLIIGGWIGCAAGVFLMCLVQINKDKRTQAEAIHDFEQKRAK